MRFVFKALAALVLVPLALGLALLIALIGLVAAPLLWERLVARLTAPPRHPDQQQQ
jgi:membrane protein implicated in regulation of membrane protease activity